MVVRMARNPKDARRSAKWYEVNKEKLLSEQRAKYAALSDDERRALQKAKYAASKDAQKVYRDNNKPQRYAYTAEWREKNLQRIIWYSAKLRAEKFDLPFDITPEDVCIPERCPVFGTILQRAIRKGGGMHSPTLDRIDNSKGYVRGNVAVISKRANNLKSDGSAVEHRLIADWIEAQQ